MYNKNVLTNIADEIRAEFRFLYTASACITTFYEFLRRFIFWHVFVNALRCVEYYIWSRTHHLKCVLTAAFRSLLALNDRILKRYSTEVAGPAYRSRKDETPSRATVGSGP